MCVCVCVCVCNFSWNIMLIAPATTNYCLLRQCPDASK